ncbi:hypothetical protein JOQ06_011714, partial [Pogonophryne albipinna]
TAGPSASSTVLQAVTAALAERPSRYGRPCLGGDCGCNLKLRGAGLAMYRALLHRDSLFWRGNSWSVNVSGGCVCVRYNSPQRGVAGVVRFAKQIENLQCSGPSKKGSVGQKLQSINWPTPDVTEQRSVVLKGIPIVLGDDSKDFFKTCFDTTRDEALSSVTVGVLTVLSEDSPQEGPSSIHLEPISTDIVLEGGIVMEKIKNFPQACYLA